MDIHVEELKQGNELLGRERALPTLDLAEAGLRKAEPSRELFLCPSTLATELTSSGADE
jgi:hypothetical protein